MMFGHNVLQKSQVSEKDDGTKNKITDEVVEHQEKSQVTEIDDDTKAIKPIEFDYDAVKDVTKKKEI
ncbi:hypothetical protein A2U01_0029787, partial [Trifolium medium]|nr:hypothetical protein [Trifolium medium]